MKVDVLFVKIFKGVLQLQMLINVDRSGWLLKGLILDNGVK